MDHQVISLYRYQDPKAVPAFHRARRSILYHQIFCWIAYLIDTLATVAITGCTVFCCYLAFTML